MYQRELITVCTIYVIIYVSGKRITSVEILAWLLVKPIYYTHSSQKKRSYTHAHTCRFTTHARNVFNASSCRHATLYIHTMCPDTWNILRRDQSFAVRDLNYIGSMRERLRENLLAKLRPTRSLGVFRWIVGGACKRRKLTETSRFFAATAVNHIRSYIPNRRPVFTQIRRLSLSARRDRNWDVAVRGGPKCGGKSKQRSNLTYWIFWISL